MKLLVFIDLGFDVTDVQTFISTFSNPKDLKQGNTLFPLLFFFALEYAIRKDQEHHVGVELSATYQLLVYTDVNLQGDKIDILKKTETLINAAKEVSLTQRELSTCCSLVA
jgi:hypothetical protein